MNKYALTWSHLHFTHYLRQCYKAVLNFTLLRMQNVCGDAPDMYNKLKGVAYSWYLLHLQQRCFNVNS